LEAWVLPVLLDHWDHKERRDQLDLLVQQVHLVLLAARVKVGLMESAACLEKPVPLDRWDSLEMLVWPELWDLLALVDWLEQLVLLVLQVCHVSNPLKWIALGPDYEYPLRQNIHLSMFYTFTLYLNRTRQVMSI